MLARGDLAIEADIASDTAPVHGLVEALLAAAPSHPVDARRDPRRCRHGLQRARPGRRRSAWCSTSSALPVQPQVLGACELLGIDPLYVANEGKFVAVVAAGGGRRRGRRAARRIRWAPTRPMIGEIVAEPGGHRGAAHRVRRHPDRRHAGRRPAAANLLTARKGGASMCLGIPGRSSRSSTRRTTWRRSTSAVCGGPSACGCWPTSCLEPGDWVLVHVGFAMAKIDETEALLTLASCQEARRRPTPTRSKRSTRPQSSEREPADEVRRRIPRPGRGARAARPSIDRAGEPGRPLQVHGGVRRAHAHHLPARHRAPAARRRRAGARPRLPGLRDPDGPGRRRDVAGRAARRDLHLVRRHDAGARLARAACSTPRRAAPTSGSSTRRSTR